jgi:hypothetical protein
MRKSVRLVSTAVLGAGLLVLTMSAPAFAADTTRPVLNLQPAAFLPGGQIGPSSPSSAENETIYTWDIPMFVTWNGSDASGICSYDVNAEPAGDYPYPLVQGTLRTRYDGDTTDYDGSFGGGSQVVDGWQVVAHDCAGNTTAKDVGVIPEVTQEDGTSNGFTAATISYSGTWLTSSCTCWSHGAVRRTTAKAAAATIGFTTGRANSPIGLVMEKAPNRGKFTLVVDGANRGTIDTYAATATHRIIVWAGRVSAAGHHTVTIVNQATAGRPRIDLDAVLTNS